MNVVGQRRGVGGEGRETAVVRGGRRVEGLKLREMSKGIWEGEREKTYILFGQKVKGTEALVVVPLETLCGLEAMHVLGGGNVVRGVGVIGVGIIVVGDGVVDGIVVVGGGGGGVVFIGIVAAVVAMGVKSSTATVAGRRGMRVRRARVVGVTMTGHGGTRSRGGGGGVDKGQTKRRGNGAVANRGRSRRDQATR